MRAASVQRAPNTTRERLIDAAAELFRRRGYVGTRVQDIAERAGLTTGAIYAHFDGKADLLVHVITTLGAAELRESLADRVDAGSTRPLLAALAERIVDRRRSRALALDAIAAAPRDPHVAARLRSQVSELVDGVPRLVEHAKADGTVDDCLDTDALATLWLAIAFGFLVVDALDLDRPTAEAWSQLMHRILGCLGPP